MTVNYLVIAVAGIICAICIFYLSKFASVLGNGNEEKNINSNLILNKLGELERNYKKSEVNTKPETKTKMSEKVFTNEIEKLASLGFTNEEIAKKTNKSVREIDLILKLKKG